MENRSKKLNSLRSKIARSTTKKEVEETSEDTVTDAPNIKQFMLVKTVKFSHNKSHTFNMVDELHIDLDQIDSEMQKQAATYGFLSVSAEVASKRADALKIQAEQVHAERYFELKKGEFTKSFPGVKMTEDGVKAALVLDKEVKLAQERYQEALHSAKVLQKYTLAILQKKDMLQSLNSSMNKDRT